MHRLLFALGLLALLAGCSAEDHPVVFVTGSSTVEPISVRVAELLEDADGEVLVDVEGPGTGDGFEKFCAGQADISDASRPIAPEEIERCEENGIEFIELPVAYDGISVLTSAQNDQVDCLSFADLYALLGPEAEGSARWDDVQRRARELGSTTDLPPLRLEITGPGEESGTYDSFVEIVLEDLGAEVTRPDYSSQSDDNAVLQGIEGSTGSLGWVGYAFASEAGDGVKQLAVDGGDGCVKPTPETIADGSYPIARTLYIYVSVPAIERNPGVTTYVDFYLEQLETAVEQVGYVPLPPEELEETRDVWTSRQTGTRAD